MDVEVSPYHEGLWGDLGAIWRDLSDRVPHASAFLSPEWTEMWLETFGPRLAPRALVWRRGDGAPVGCALVSSRTVSVGPFRLTRSFLNASGDFVVGAEHNDVLALPDYRSEILADLVRVVLGMRPQELGLVGFRAEAGQELRAHWPSSHWEGYESEGPYVRLDELRSAGTPYLSALSSNTRSKIRRSLRAYGNRMGDLSFEVAEDRATALEWLEGMIRLHEARWHGQGLPGAFADPRALEFHRSLIQRYARAADDAAPFAVDIARVTAGSEAIAYLYNIRYDGIVSFYQAGFEYHDDNRLRPGLVAHAMAVEHYLEAGLREYDFLAGEPEPVQYKRSLSTDVRQFVWIELPVPSLRMWSIRWLRRARRRLRGFFGSDRQ